jgi:hypothetical protein
MQNDKSAVSWLRKKINNALIGEIPLHRWDSLQSLFTEAEKMENERISSHRDYPLTDGSKVDLAKLEAKFDEVLSKETPESFKEWLDAKRGKEQQNQIIKEKTEEDAKDGLYDHSVNDTEMVSATYTGEYPFPKQETFYTDEDMLNAFYTGYLSKDLIWELAKKLFKESLKQPKKD